MTKRASQNDEAALRALGDLYLYFGEVHGGSMMRMNVGRIFYKPVRDRFHEQWLTLKKTYDFEARKPFLRKWFELEYEDLGDEDSQTVDTIM